MYHHLLIAYDGSEIAQTALRQGIELAKIHNASLTVVTVTEPWHAFSAGETTVSFPIDEYETNVAKWADDVLAEARRMAAEAGIDCRTIHVDNKYPAEGILETAALQNCDLIVMSSHGHRGLTRLLLGSQATQVVTHSDRPVLICR